MGLGKIISGMMSNAASGIGKKPSGGSSSGGSSSGSSSSGGSSGWLGSRGQQITGLPGNGSGATIDKGPYTGGASISNWKGNSSSSGGSTGGNSSGSGNKGSTGGFLGGLLGSFLGPVGAVGGATVGTMIDAMSGAGSGSSSSSGSSGSSGGGYVAKGTYNDSDLRAINPEAAARIDSAKQRYDECVALGDVNGANLAHQEAESIRAMYGYSGGTDGSQNLNGGNGFLGGLDSVIGGFQGGGTAGYPAGPNYAEIERPYQDGYDQAQDYLEQARAEALRAQQAAVDKNVLELDAQKGNVGKAGEQGNRAAQEAYMTVVNPNGSLAESLAARGLLSSGLTESSQVQAGNTYQSALNANQNTVTQQLSEIERAISAAKLNGDLTSAQILASYAEKVASMVADQANTMLSFGQWKAENAQNNYKWSAENENAKKAYEMEKQRLDEELLNGKITRERWEQEKRLLEEQIRAAQMDNRYSQAQLNELGY